MGRVPDSQFDPPEDDYEPMNVDNDHYVPSIQEQQDPDADAAEQYAEEYRDFDCDYWNRIT